MLNKLLQRLFYLTLSRSQEPGHSVALGLRLTVSRECAVKLLGLQCHLKAQVEEDPLLRSLLWLLAGFTSPQAGALRASVFHWLSSRDLCIVYFILVMCLTLIVSKMGATAFL